MRRWTGLVLVSCAAGVAAAQWALPAAAQGLLSGLLLLLVILTVFSQHGTMESLKAAHNEQLETERRYRALFDACSDAILVYQVEDDGSLGRLAEVNEAACLGLGYSRAQLLSMAVEDIHAPEASRQVRERLRGANEAGTVVFETVLLTSDRERLPVEVSARLVYIGGRRLCLAVSHSIAAQKELEGFLRGLTSVDELTGLLNRRGFFLKAEDIRRKALRLHSQVLVMYLDVDGLKRVNDELGHAEGDKLLVAAADVLRTAFRDEDVVARLGGDEFVALAMLGRRQDERLDCQAIEARLEAGVAAKRGELGDAIGFSVSFGTEVATPAQLDAIDDLLARADQQMYKVKRSRRRKARQGAL